MITFLVCLCIVMQLAPSFLCLCCHTPSVTVMHLSMLSPRGGGGGGTPGICGAFDFSEEFLVKIPTVGPQNLVKSDQISPP